MIAAFLLGLVSRPSVTLRGPAVELVIDLGDTERQSINLTIANDSGAPITIWQAAFWQNHRLELYTLQGSRVRKTSLGEASAKRFGGDRDHNVPVRIANAHSYRYSTPRIPEYFALAPGKYWVQVTYDDTSFGEHRVVRAVPIRILVTD
jgi:hypothetical protein